MQRIQEGLGGADLVLDIGGWGKPFRRADWVIDAMPYETRGLLGFDGDGPERYSRETWIQRDLCDHEPYPFGDKEVDFVVCSHTLEDVRDPVWVCQEMIRIAKAGYIETPSRLEEQSYGFQGPWVGWGHHHWLVETTPGGIEFVFKHHVVNRPGDHFPAGFRDSLAPDERVTTLWWEGTFECGERLFVGPEELDPYLRGFVDRNLQLRGWDGRTPLHRRLRSLLARRP